MNTVDPVLVHAAMTDADKDIVGLMQEAKLRLLGEGPDGDELWFSHCVEAVSRTRHASALREQSHAAIAKARGGE